MEIVKIVGLGLVAGTLAILLRQHRPAIATLLSLAAGALILLLVMDRIAGITDVLQDLALRANVDGLYLGIVLKVIGVAFLTEFGAQVLRDAGESSIASKVELAGKIIIVVLAIPIIAAILQTLSSMLG
ncbi:MAG: stage III sporulation protein AD [Firmicutes bacterium]|nr:stage III sporulation protein AD [Bacillota bacterium]